MTNPDEFPPLPKPVIITSGNAHWFSPDQMHAYVLAARASRPQAQEVAASDARDALRYRWLRDNPWNPALEDVITMHRNKRWDVEIDAALASQAGKEQTP